MEKALLVGHAYLSKNDGDIFIDFKYFALMPIQIVINKSPSCVKLEWIWFKNKAPINSKTVQSYV